MRGGVELSQGLKVNGMTCSERPGTAAALSSSPRGGEVKGQASSSLTANTIADECSAALPTIGSRIVTRNGSGTCSCVLAPYEG